MRFSQIKYILSEAIFALLLNKANADLLVLWWLNLIIRNAKSVNALVVKVEILEH